MEVKRLCCLGIFLTFLFVIGGGLENVKKYSNKYRPCLTFFFIKFFFFLHSFSILES